MHRVFLDTSGLIAMATRTDRHHVEAAGELSRLKVAGARFVTHDGIRIELLDTLSAPRARAGAAELVHHLSLWSSAGEIEIHALDCALIDRAIELFKQRPDKAWGLTDCLSFVLMTDLGILEAFTSDHHFAQAGFVRLIGVGAH